jgi:hypothetical protein
LSDDFNLSQAQRLYFAVACMYTTIASLIAQDVPLSMAMALDTTTNDINVTFGTGTGTGTGESVGANVGTSTGIT